MKDSKARNLTKLLFIIAIPLIMICATSYQLLKHKCFWWDCAPDRTFSVFDLDLPAEFFPTGAELPTLMPDRGIITAIEEARGASNWEGGGAVYVIDGFATEWQARNWFELRARKNFFTAPLESDNLFIDVLTYRSSVADEYKISCGYILERTSCILQARYKEFYLLFNGYLSENGLTQSDFLGILKYIDRRMLSLLQ